MDKYFTNILLISSPGLNDCQAVGRDRYLFIGKEKID